MSSLEKRSIPDIYFHHEQHLHDNPDIETAEQGVLDHFVLGNNFLKFRKWVVYVDQIIEVLELLAWRVPQELVELLIMGNNTAFAVIMVLQYKQNRLASVNS